MIMNLISCRECDDKTWINVSRILSVWAERSIYGKPQIAEWKKAIGERKVSIEVKASSSGQRAAMKAKREKDHKEAEKRKKASHPNNPSSTATRPSSNSSNSIPSPARPAIGSKLILPPAPVPSEGVIIDPDVLIKALRELESAASNDSVVREKIASFPPEVSDASLLDKIRDKGTAEKLARQVDIACSLLMDYNSRLSRELEDRKQVSIMLATYIKNQKDHVSVSDQKLNEYKDKLKRVSQVRSELKSHLQNLPDLSLLPSVTGGLAPLPSAGDLFNIANAVARGQFQKPSSTGSTSSTSPSTASPAEYETQSLLTPN